MDTIDYFAYGSNMNISRMVDRGITPKKSISFELQDYKLVMNKKSYKNPSMGFANIIPKQNSIVEGVLYTINRDDIKKLDKFEGYPKHYNKNILKIDNNEIYVYVANPKWESDVELNVTEKYKNHILKGKQFLSEKYYNDIIKKIKCNG